MMGKAGGAISLAFLAYAGYKGGQSVYESWKKGKKGEALVKAGALPFTGGYKMGEEWEKKVGEGMFRSGESGPLSASTRAMMAHSKDKSLTNVLSMKLMDAYVGPGAKTWKKMRKEVINVDWKTLALAKKKYKAIDADIKRLEEKKRLDGFLNDADEATLKLRKAEAKQLEGRVKGIKRLVKAESDEVVTARMRKDQMSDIIEGMRKVDFGNLGTKKGVRGELQKVIKSSGRLYAYKGSEKAFKKLMDDPLLGAQLRAMAKSANMTPEELLKMYTEESTAMGKGKGAPAGVKGALAGSKQGQAALMQYIQDMKKKGMPVEVTRAMARKFGVSEDAFKGLSSMTAKEFRIATGDSKGTETTVENADGGRTRVITTTQKMYITQDGSDRQKTAANNELQVQRMKNNKESKG